MIYLRKSPILFRTRNRRRGSVIVLVVAVLALLAVIGTVYIVTSRTERTAAQSAQAAANVDNAQKAVMEAVNGVIGGSVLDGNGNLAGYNPLGTYGQGMARSYDMPEINTGPGGPGYSLFNLANRDQSWLVANLYRPSTGMVFSDNYYNDMSLLTPNLFNPLSGAYDIAAYQINNPNRIPNPAIGLFNVVSDPLPTIPIPPNGPFVQAGPDAFVQLLPFSEANGVRYRFGVRILDTSRMLNLNVGSARAFDGANYGALPTYLQSGTFYNGYLLANPAATFDSTPGMGAPIDAAGSLDATAAGPGAANLGRFGMYNPSAVLPATPLEYIVQQQMFRAEYPVRYVPSPAFWDNRLFSPFDVSDELALRALGALGTFAQPRASMASNQVIWPNTLGNLANPPSATIQGNLRRDSYTTYSYSRDLRLYTGPSIPYSLHNFASVMTNPSADPSRVWPLFPARAAAMPDVAAYTRRYPANTPPANIPAVDAALSLDTLAIAATNIATAMEKLSGYNHQEACSFAANYLTFRWNSWSVVSPAPSGAAVPVYSMPTGPSFIDNTGICIRTDAGSYNYNNAAKDTHDLRSETPGKVYLGFAAQPFINEVAVIDGFDTVAGAKVVRDCAVELYNPFTVALSLDDYELYIDNVAYDLSGKNLWIPQRGYFVLTQQSIGLKDTITNANAQKHDDATFTVKDATTVYLMRKYVARDGTTALGAIDQYDISTLAAHTPVSGDADKKIFVARANGVATPRRWIATTPSPASLAMHFDTGIAPDRMSLGDRNDDDPTITTVIPLYDRVLENATIPAFNRRDPLLNLADFNRVMRIASEIDANATGKPVGNGVITAQLSAALTPTDVGLQATQLPSEAAVHFDFRAIPALYNSVAGHPDMPGTANNPNPPTLPPTIYKPGDIRAVHLLDCLAIADRVSDFTIDIGDNNNNARGLSKIRIPGQINVNTASPEVLKTIPVLGANPSYIGLILAYRYRTITTDARISVAYRPNPAVDFSNPAEFPGYGIRSLAELQIPFYQATGTTLANRDQVWASIIAPLTVRSDTFVVYAYLEAVRLNPRYGGAFNNGSDWYNNTAAAVTDDPNDSLHPLQRVARRRWVSIVDRSQSNNTRAQPLIVAQKDLPR